MLPLLEDILLLSVLKLSFFIFALFSFSCILNFDSFKEISLFLFLDDISLSDKFSSSTENEDPDEELSSSSSCSSLFNC